MKSKELLQALQKHLFMCSNLHTSSTAVDFKNGKKLTIESGGLAKLADGSALLTIGNTSVLVTAVSKIRNGPSASFMPLTVDYRQKYVAAGRIPSNFLRRELAPTEKEILTSRLIDRSVRPLFPKTYMHDTQLCCNLMAVDGLLEPDVVTINAASAALSLSDIPWEGPVGAVRVGVIDGETVVFPTKRELMASSLNLVVTAAENSQIVMLEGGGSPVPLHDLQRALKEGVKECQSIVAAIKALATQKGVNKRHYETPEVPSHEMVESVRSISETRLTEIFCDTSHNKLSRDSAVQTLRQDVLYKLKGEFEESSNPLLSDAFNIISKEVFRDLIMEKDVRCDGRGLRDLRPIECSVSLFSPLHGSSLFQRGHTQVQCTVAFDAPDKALIVDPLLEVTGGSENRHFLLHYSFPSFANNELSRGGPPSRREMGHGALAARALRPLLPLDIPFSVLLSATVMESNGSSSMATVCGGTLALLDAGVRLSAPVAGVAMGLITSANEHGHVDDYKILTDILGIEDHLGDMDLKVAGTRQGITALQADIKLSGVPISVINSALQEALLAKNKILDIMKEVIDKPRESNANKPVFFTKDIPLHKRGAVLGVGGMNIKAIQVQAGVKITLEESGSVSIFAPNQNAMDEALFLIDQKMKGEPDFEFGSIYTARITEIRAQGVMVTLYDNMKPVLLHNSQLDARKVQDASVLGLSVGSEIKVKYFGVDPTSGHVRLSRKALQATAAGGAPAKVNLHS